MRDEDGLVYLLFRYEDGRKRLDGVFSCQHLALARIRLLTSQDPKVAKDDMSIESWAVDGRSVMFAK